MSTTDLGASETEAEYAVPAKLPTAKKPLHQLGRVRRRQGISRRMMARRLKSDVGNVKWQEQETSDMLLSTLYEWQKVLEVPVAELLVDTDEGLSPPVLKRAQMVRLMKTVTAILERTEQPAIRRMAQMMADQLIEIMPELEGVGPWHVVGQRRTLNELGQAAHRKLSFDVFLDLID